MKISMTQWILSTFLGWVLGVVFILLLSGTLEAMGFDGMQFYLGIGMGAGIGIVQWIRLRNTRISFIWFWISMLGMGVPFLLLDLLFPVVRDWKLPVGVMLGALASGFLQGKILSKKAVNPGHWLFATLVGWFIAVMLLTVIEYTQQFRSSGIQNLVLALLNLGIILAGGIALGVATGWVLVRSKSISEA